MDKNSAEFQGLLKECLADKAITKSKVFFPSIHRVLEKHAFDLRKHSSLELDLAAAMAQEDSKSHIPHPNRNKEKFVTPWYLSEANGMA